MPILCEPYTRARAAGGCCSTARSRLSRDGQPVHHFFVASTHRRVPVVPESGAIAVPGEMPFDRACIIGCGVMTGVGAARAQGARRARRERRRDRLRRGRASTCCRARGSPARRAIIAVDVGAAKLDAGAPVRRHRRHRRRRRRRARRRSARSPAAAAPTTSSRPPAHEAAFRLARRGGAARRPGRLARQDQRRCGGRVPLGLADGREADRPLELRRRDAEARLPVARRAVPRRQARCSTSSSRGGSALDEINDGFAASRAARHPHRLRDAVSHPPLAAGHIDRRTARALGDLRARIGRDDRRLPAVVRRPRRARWRAARTRSSSAPRSPAPTIGSIS